MPGVGTLVIPRTLGPIFGLLWTEVGRGGSVSSEACGMGPTQEKVLFLTEEMGGRDWLSLSLCDSTQFTDYPMAGEGVSLAWVRMDFFFVFVIYCYTTIAVLSGLK